MIRLGFGFLSIASGLRLRHYGVLQKPEVRLTCPRGPQGKDGVYGEVCVSGVCINKEKSKGTGLLKGTMNALFLKGLAAKTHRGDGSPPPSSRSNPVWAFNFLFTRLEGQVSASPACFCFDYNTQLYT